MPAPQSAQFAEETNALYLPAAQDVQVLAASPEYLPIAQLVQVVRSAIVEIFPAEQFVQEAAAPELNVPTAQVLHEVGVFAVAAYVPAGHSVQEAAAAAE